MVKQQLISLEQRQRSQRDLETTKTTINTLQERIRKLRSPGEVRKVKGIEGLKRINLLRKRLNQEVTRGNSIRTELQRRTKLSTPQEFISRERSRILSEQKDTRNRVRQALRKDIPTRFLRGGVRKIVSEIRAGRSSVLTQFEKQQAERKRRTFDIKPQTFSNITLPETNSNTTPGFNFTKIGRFLKDKVKSPLFR